MAKPVVALVNASTVLADKDIEALLAALQVQVTRDLAPAWGLEGADLVFMADRNAPQPLGAWVLAILDDSDQAGDLGYHDVTAASMPMGKVFARTDLQYGEDWRVTVSHELLELLVDPWCTTQHRVAFQGRAVVTIEEVCDAVEADACGYEIEGQLVSDFVLPPFFDTFSAHAPGTRFDLMGHLAAPMTIAPGGYLSILDPSGGTGWSQVFGQHVALHKRLAPRGSRRERLQLRENHRRPWQKSTAV